MNEDIANSPMQIPIAIHITHSLNGVEGPIMIMSVAWLTRFKIEYR